MQKRKFLLFTMRLFLCLFVLCTSIGAWADDTSINVDGVNGNGKLKGAGTLADPYLIGDSLDWVTFADSVNNGVSYDGKYFRLTADITVAKMAGSDANRFLGTFDGGCYTMTLDKLSSTTETCAPFRYVEGATIRNLHITGTVIAGSHSSNDKYRGGFIGRSSGHVFIDNCWSSVTITTSINGDGTHGGFVGINDGNLTITNSLFDGTISGSSTYANSGFVGWTGGNIVNIKNCLMAGTMNVKTTNGATFSRGNENNTASNIKVVNSYYVTSHGTIQGTSVGDMPNDTLLEALGSVWEIKNDKVVPFIDYQNIYTATVAGLEHPLLWTGNAIDANYTVKDDHGNVLTLGTDYTSAISPEEVLEVGEYTLTITGVNSYKGTKTISFNVNKQLSGDGTLEAPYLISNANDWNTFSSNVNAGDSYSNAYVKFADEFDNTESPVTVQVGIGIEKPFSGTLLGNNKTLHVNLTNTVNETNEVAQGVAPFHYIKNATIKDLTIAGTISSASYHTSGLVGFADGENLLEGCVVNATLNITNNYAGGIVGHGRSSATTIKDCIFAGSINGGNTSRSNIGGIWGWSDTAQPKLQNCLEKGTYTYISSMHPMGLQGNSGSITDCYYLTAQKGSPSNVCTVSGATRVYTAEQAGKITKYQKLVDGADYYLEGNSSITGLKDIYEENNGSGIYITYTVNFNGAALTADTDYTVTITDSNNQVVTDSVKVRGIYKLTVTGTGDYRGSMSKDITVLGLLSGDGSVETPYLINNNEDWDIFAANVNNGRNYNGKYIQMTDSITVTKMAGVNKDNSFQGTFLGTAGKAMKLNLTGTANDCAPFANLKDATIKDLNITGTITTGYKYAASIAAHTYGTTNIKNCVSTVEITSTFPNANTDGTHAGFVAVKESQCVLNIDSCVFRGKLLGANATSNGGFVGFANQDGNKMISYTDCLFAPAEITMSAENSATFNRNGVNTFTRTYYLTQFGEAQGNKVVVDVPENDVYKAVIAVDGENYNAICNVTGLEKFYRYTGDAISVVPVVTFGSQKLTLDTDYTVTIKDSKDSIVALDSLKMVGDYTIKIVGAGDYEGELTDSFRIFKGEFLNGYAFETDTDDDGTYYLINNAEDFERLAAYVNSKDNVSNGQRFVQMNNITVSTMVGSNEKRSFQGIYDGGNNTLTIDLNGTIEYCAPFSYLKNATIKDLNIAGTITTGKKYGASLAGTAYGTVNITNCVSTAEIISTFETANTDGTHGGFMALTQGGSEVNFSNCVFKGKLLGANATSNGGFVGWNGSKINFTDCLFAPAEITMSAEESATFNRNSNSTFTRAYYLEAYGEAQGLKVLAEAPATTMYKEVTAADGNTYFAPCDVTGVNELYVHTGDAISVVPVVTFGSQKLTLDTDYTVTIKDSKDSIVAPDSLKSIGDYTIKIAGAGDYKGSHTLNFRIVNGEVLNGYAFETGTDDEGTFYMISSAEDFESLAAYVNSADNVSSGKRFVQMNNITVSTMVGPNEQKSFQGIYDGGNNTLTLAISASQNVAGPFHDIKNATIKNLKIDGTLTNSGKQNGGVAGYSYGTVNISNCVVSASINCGFTGDSSNGGFIAHIQNGSVTFNDCVFNGRLLGETATCSGGFVGWRDNKNIVITYNNCLFAPTEVTMSAEGSATFNRNKTDNNKYNSCYYLTQFGDVQGVKVLAEAPATMSKIFAAADGNTYYIPGDVTVTGIEDLYFYFGGVVSVTPGVEFSGEKLTLDTDYTVTIKDSKGAIVTPDSLKAVGNYTIIIAGAGNYTGEQTDSFRIYAFETATDDEGTFYMISSAEDFEHLAAYVNSADNVSSGKRFVQMDNMTINTVVGLDEGKSFQGTYDGGHHTLTLDLTASANDCAPFATLKNATVKNLNIDGSITTDYKYSSSIAGHTYGTNHIQNCVSTVVITSTFTTAGSDGTHAGFVGENSGSAYLYFNNCAFKGKLLGGNAIKVSGFLGWNQGELVSYTDCLFAPAEVTMSAEGSATFNRNGKNTFTRTYYLESFGEVQGKQVYVADNVPATGFYGQVPAADGNPYFIETVVSNINDSCAYTGDAIVIEPTFSIEDESPAFVAGVDYEVSFSIDGNPVDEIKEVGNYVVTITGKDGGKCKGSFTKDFKVYSTVPTGIATTKEAGVKNHDIYTIGGVKLNGKSAKKGLYIKNGVVISVK